MQLLARRTQFGFQNHEVQNNPSMSEHKDLCRSVDFIIANLHSSVPEEMKDAVHAFDFFGSNKISEIDAAVKCDDGSIIFFGSAHILMEKAARLKIPEIFRYAVVIKDGKVQVINEAGELIAKGDYEKNSTSLPQINPKDIITSNTQITQSYDRTLVQIAEATKTFNLSERVDTATQKALATNARADSNTLARVFGAHGLLKLYDTAPVNKLFSVPKNSKPNLVRVYKDKDEYRVITYSDDNKTVAIIAKWNNLSKKYKTAAALEFNQDGSFKTIKTCGITAGYEMGAIEHSWFSLVTAKIVLITLGEPLKIGLGMLAEKDDKFAPSILKSLAEIEKSQAYQRTSIAM